MEVEPMFMCTAMKTLNQRHWIFYALSFLAGSLLGGTPIGPVVSYLSGDPGSRLYNGLALSDGSFLVCGEADNLDFLPENTPTVELTGSAVDAIDSSGSGKTGFILQLDGDFTRILACVHFPDGKVMDIRRLRSTEVPGQPTGRIYLSGARKVTSTSTDGYFIAKLDENFVDALPSALEWSAHIRCRPRNGDINQPSDHKWIQPWDLQPDGTVIYGAGQSFDYSWAEIRALDGETGEPTTMPGWTIHWGNNGEHYDNLDTYPGTPSHSGIVLKQGRDGQLRSRTWEDYEAWGTTSNGEPRRGSYPDDLFFSEPITSGNGGGGYTGYRTGSRDTARVGGIAVDRRNGYLYFGYCYQSTLPGGNPDYEPAVVAMDNEGNLIWWDRLYRDFVDSNDNGIYDPGEARNSSPDQYVDGVAIDYANDQVVFLARSHGNNVINFHRGNTLAASPGTEGFQNQFTGNNGNIHLSWLGKFDLLDGRILHSTYLGEFSAGYNPGPTYRFSSGLLEGWPNPNAGWADLNTTRCATELAVDAQGRVYVTFTGSRPMSTSNAFQQMEPHGTGTGSWSDVIRVYESDLSGIHYSSILRGPWSSYEGNNIELYGTVPFQDRVLVLGWHAEEDGQPRGAPMPTAAVPDFGKTQPASGEIAVFAFLDTEPDPDDIDGDRLPDDWERLHFGDLAASATDDHDQDGIPALLEFAQGTEPDNAQSRPESVPSVVSVGGIPHLTLRYQRLQGGSGTAGIDYTARKLRYTVEFSQDLSLWESGAGRLTVHQLQDNGDGTETVTVQALSSIEDPAFLRLKVIPVP